MKRNFRYYLALFVAQFTAFGLKLFGKKATNMPGLCAINICPDFLARMHTPEKVLGITGTNGKTTVSNMIEDVLEDCGYDFICNKKGSNVDTGVISAFLANSTFFGKPKKKLAILELDERSAPKIFPQVKPEMILCTNIFRDSYRRNAHAEFIMDILNKYTSKDTKLILNSDDLISGSLCPQNERVYFGINKMEGETNDMKNIVCDVRSCPVCGEKLTWDFIRYHHIGQAKCEACGHKNPKANYKIVSIDIENMKIHVEMQGAECEFPLLNSNLINIYNELSAIAFLGEFGLTTEQIKASLQKMRISETRYSEEIVKDKKIIMHIAKGQNPVACSRACENVRSYPGKKSVMLLMDDFPLYSTIQNVAWFYDTDFEFLNDPDVVQIVMAGRNHWDVYVRILMAGVPEEKIVHMDDPVKAAGEMNVQDSESIWVLHDIYNFSNQEASEVKARIKEKIQNLN
jgi:UDP-N-acetylmuramyl tripeptide synthase